MVDDRYVNIVLPQYFSEILSDFDDILHAVAHKCWEPGTVTKRISPKPKILKSDMAYGRHIR